MRFYTQGYVYGVYPGFKPPSDKRVGDLVDKTFVLFFDTKTGKHHFVNVKYLDSFKTKTGYWYGQPKTYQPVVFETLEQEAEFLTHHPDAKYSTQGWGGWVQVPYQAADAEKFPIVFRKKRWVWNCTRHVTYT